MNEEEIMQAKSELVSATLNVVKSIETYFTAKAVVNYYIMRIETDKTATDALNELKEILEFWVDSTGHYIKMHGIDENKALLKMNLSQN